MPRRLLVAGAISLLAPTALAAQVAGPPTVPLHRFPVGETLVFDVRYGLLTLGAGMMHVAGIDTVRGAPAVHATFVLKGGPWFYRINDRMDSWFGLHDFASRRFVQDFQEGGSQRQTAYEIYPDSGVYRDLVADSLRPTAPQPLDDTAFFYFVRSLDLEVGRRYEFQRYFRPDRNPVVIEVIGRDTLDLPAGRFPCLVIRPIIKGRGILAESQDPRLWISDDERRLIVQLKSTFASIATITLRLREVTDRPPPELVETRAQQ